MRRFVFVCAVLLGCSVLAVGPQVQGETVVTSGTQATTYSGTMDLSKNTDGSAAGGTFILNKANNFVGTTTVNAGTLQVTNKLICTNIVINNGGIVNLANGGNNALGGNGECAIVTINAGGTLTTTVGAHNNIRTLNLAGGTITSTQGNADNGSYLFGGRVNVTENSTISAVKLTVRGGWGTAGETGLWTVADGKTLSVSSVLRIAETSGGSGPSMLEKLGGGTMALTGSGLQLTEGGTLKMTAGLVTAKVENISNQDQTRSPLQFNGGTLQITNRGDLLNPVSITADSKLVINHADSNAFNSAWTGTKNLTYQSSTRAVTWLKGAMTDYSGIITMDATAGSEFFVVMDGAAQNSSSYAIHFADNLGRLTFNSDSATDTDFRVGMLSGNGEVRHYYSETVESQIKLQVGNNTEYENHDFGGKIYDRVATQTIAVEKVGTNTWTLSSENAFSGGVTVTSGTLEVKNNNNVLGSGTLTMNGGTLRFLSTLTLPNALHMAKASTIDVNPGGNCTITGAITGTGTLTKTGGNILVFSGSLAGFNGEMNMTNGWYLLRGAATDGANVNFSNGNLAFIADSKSTYRIGMLAAGTEVRPSSDGVNSGKTITLQVGNDTEYAKHTSTANYNNGSYTLALEKVGTNTWTLTNTASSFKGGTKITGGVLEITGKVLGSGTVTLNGGTLRATGESFWMDNAFAVTENSSIDLPTDKQLTLTGEISGTKQVTLKGGTLLLTGKSSPNWVVSSGTLEMRAPAAEGSESVQIAEGAKVLFSSKDNQSVGTVGLKFTGTGTIELTAPNVSTFAGDFSGFTGKFVSKPGYAAVFNTDSSLKGMEIQQSSGTTLCFTNRDVSDTGIDAEIGMINGSGTLRPSSSINNSNRKIFITVGSDKNYVDHTFAGVIIDWPDANSGLFWTMGIEKVGSNTWTLSGTSTYSGTTTVSGGTLELAAAGKITASDVTVCNGATLLNAGTISKSVTVEDGGILNVNGGTITGDLTLKTGATLMGDYLGKLRTEAGANLRFDLDDLAGNMVFEDGSDLFDETLVSLFSEDMEIGDKYDLIESSSNILNHLIFDTTGVLGDFALIPIYENGMVSLMALSRDAVPEPATWVLMVLGGVGLCFARRGLRRRA